MAEAKKKRRVVKKSETVRQKREKSAVAKPKQRRIRKAVGKTSTPFKVVGRGIVKIIRPFSPLLRPFKTKPMRFIGRVLAKILFLGYIRDSWRELRQVEWPTRRETFNLTVAVFVFAITFALLIALLDFGLDKVFKQLLV